MGHQKFFFNNKRIRVRSPWNDLAQMTLQLATWEHIERKTLLPSLKLLLVHINHRYPFNLSLSLVSFSYRWVIYAKLVYRLKEKWPGSVVIFLISRPFHHSGKSFLSSPHINVALSFTCSSLPRFQIKSPVNRGLVLAEKRNGCTSISVPHFPFILFSCLLISCNVLFSSKFFFFILLCRPRHTN